MKYFPLLLKFIISSSLRSFVEAYLPISFLKGIIAKRNSFPTTVNSGTVPSYGGGMNSTAVSVSAVYMEFWGWSGNIAGPLGQKGKASIDSPRFLSKASPIQQSNNAFTRQKQFGMAQDGSVSSALGSQAWCVLINTWIKDL